jgi:hypothetical protein
MTMAMGTLFFKLTTGYGKGKVPYMEYAPNAEYYYNLGGGGEHDAPGLCNRIDARMKVPWSQAHLLRCCSLVWMVDGEMLHKDETERMQWHNAEFWGAQSGMRVYWFCR